MNPLTDIRQDPKHPEGENRFFFVVTASLSMVLGFIGALVGTAEVPFIIIWLLLSLVSLLVLSLLATFIMWGCWLFIGVKDYIKHLRK